MYGHNPPAILIFISERSFSKYFFFQLILVCETTKENDFKLFLHSPEDIANTFITQPRNMLTLTHTNYLCHFRDIENIVGAANILTQSDVLLNEWQTDLSKELAIIAGTRGLMVYNEKPITGWMPIRSSKQLNSR